MQAVFDCLANSILVGEAILIEACICKKKARIEKQLGVGHDRAYYRAALEEMGYKVTSVNESDEDTLEMEVVKGDTSYEVEVDFDDKTKKSTKVDVSTNMWETDYTEVAKGEN